MRKDDFLLYLLRKYKINTCQNILSFAREASESIGCDLEAVVYENKKCLDAEEKLENKPSHIINAFKQYKEFALANPHTPYSKTPRRGEDFRTTHVRYATSVELSEQMPGLCLSLELEYSSILTFAKKHFASILGNFKPIEVVLDSSCPMEEHHVDEEYIQMLEQKRNRTKEEEEIFRRRGILTRKLGCFEGGSEPRIRIYYRNFSWVNLGEYCASVINCLAHEYMHYLQSLYCSQITCNYADFEKNKKVKEALADFFGMLFSLCRGSIDDFTIVEDRRESWERMWMTGWPYSYALYFRKGKRKRMSNNYFDYEFNGSVAKMLSVFKECHIPTLAFKLLIT